MARSNLYNWLFILLSLVLVLSLSLIAWQLFFAEDRAEAVVEGAVESAKVWRTTLLWVASIGGAVFLFYQLIKAFNKRGFRTLTVNEFLSKGVKHLRERRGFETIWCDIILNRERNPESNRRVFVGVFSEAPQEGETKNNTFFIACRNDSWETREVSPRGLNYRDFIDWVYNVEHRLGLSFDANSTVAAAQKIRDTVGFELDDDALKQIIGLEVQK